MPGPSVALLCVLLVAGCTANGRKQSQATATPVASAPALEDATFTVPENMLDTWNTIGQIVIHIDGVQYESRAQMLGLYELRYRGEHLLIRCRALALQGAGRQMLTQVVAMTPDGSRNDSPAADELMHILQRDIPLEIGKYRQTIKFDKHGQPILVDAQGHPTKTTPTSKPKSKSRKAKRK
ncbi:MAG: putative lipoprotein [Xanthomonadaceae bacterium]|nr:putative lipoprotein [Xanthomonadaceae bacterium]